MAAYFREAALIPLSTDRSTAMEWGEDAEVGRGFPRLDDIRRVGYYGGGIEHAFTHGLIDYPKRNPIQNPDKVGGVW